MSQSYAENTSIYLEPSYQFTKPGGSSAALVALAGGFTHRGGASVWPWLDDCSLVIERGMTGATGNLYCGLHEFTDMAFLLHFLRPEDGFADVGANIGSYSVLAAGVRDAKVMAFEPHPTTCGKLKRNIRVNDIADKVRVVQTAVGREAGVVRFSADRDTMNHVLHDDASCDSFIEVPLIDLNEGLKDFSAVLWKLDVEGYEEEVLEGAKEVLSNPALKALMIETESARSREILRGNGFEMCSYDPFRREITSRESGSSHNALWIRDRHDCTARVKKAPAIEVFGVRF